MKSNFVVSDCHRPFGFLLLIKDTWFLQDSGVRASNSKLQRPLSICCEPLRLCIIQECQRKSSKLTKGDFQVQRYLCGIIILINCIELVCFYKTLTHFFCIILLFL